MPIPLSGAHWANYKEHLIIDTGVTIEASSRLTFDYQENILGHRSGICVSSGTASVSASQGAQTQATAYLTQTSAADWGSEGQRRRFNPDAQ